MDRIEQARTHSADLTGTRALGELLEAGTVREQWPDLPLDIRQSVLDAFVDRVTVNPATRRGRGFDPDRLDVWWKA